MSDLVKWPYLMYMFINTKYEGYIKSYAIHYSLGAISLILNPCLCYIHRPISLLCLVFMFCHTKPDCLGTASAWPSKALHAKEHKRLPLSCFNINNQSTFSAVLHFLNSHFGKMVIHVNCACINLSAPSTSQRESTLIPSHHQRGPPSVVSSCLGTITKVQSLGRPSSGTFISELSTFSYIYIYQHLKR